MRRDGLVLGVLAPGLALRNKPHLSSMTWLLPSRLPLSVCCRYFCLLHAVFPCQTVAGLLYLICAFLAVAGCHLHASPSIDRRLAVAQPCPSYSRRVQQLQLSMQPVFRTQQSSGSSTSWDLLRRPLAIHCPSWASTFSSPRDLSASSSWMRPSSACTYAE